jgi:hypothetical protein
LGLIHGCGEHAFESGASIAISSPHPTEDGIIQWDPNLEPVLVLSVKGNLAASYADSIRWRQDRWQVDDRQWQGQDLRVHISTPGCGYGGQSFVITASSGDGSQIASVTVWMEPYICDGSPWKTD